MTEQERLTLCDKLATRRDYLLQRAAVDPQMAKVWREFAERDTARIARLRCEPAEANEHG